MINSLRERDSEIESSKQATQDNKVNNDKSYAVLYTSDNDGAYHVEQDDETEDDHAKT